MSWTFQPASKSFPFLHKEWDELNKRGSDHVLLDSGFVGPLLRHFGDDRTVLGIQNGGSNPGMALLQRKTIGVWETFQPSQAPIGLILLADADKAGQELLQITRQLPGYALQLSVLQQDPDHTSFPSPENPNHVELLEYIRTARITLPPTFEEYWKSRGTNLRHNLSRRRRRLAEKGYSLELHTLRQPGQVAEAIREFGRLEAKGWKGKEGTAVAEDNVQGRFYRELFEGFCARGQGVIYQLKFNGQIAASDLCLKHNGMIVILKTAYDEELNDFSPAFLMREESMKELCAEKGMRLIEYYGRVMEWHMRWTDEVRTLYHLTCYRHPWVKQLRKIAKRFS
jgi:CelD/BcsL family acetyltransferase involved in cellulose biosynthesis